MGFLKPRRSCWTGYSIFYFLNYPSCVFFSNNFDQLFQRISKRLVNLCTLSKFHAVTKSFLTLLSQSHHSSDDGNQGCKFDDSRNIQVWESISLIELCTKCLSVYYIWFSQAATNLHPWKHKCTLQGQLVCSA